MYWMLFKSLVLNRVNAMHYSVFFNFSSIKNLLFSNCISITILFTKLLKLRSVETFNKKQRLFSILLIRCYLAFAYISKFLLWFFFLNLFLFSYFPWSFPIKIWWSLSFRSVSSYCSWKLLLWLSYWRLALRLLNKRWRAIRYYARWWLPTNCLLSLNRSFLVLCYSVCAWFRLFVPSICLIDFIIILAWKLR